MSLETPQWIVLAHLIRPQGRKGELLAELLTDFPDRLAGREGLLLVRPSSGAEASQAKNAQVISCWLPVGKNRGRIVLKLEGVDTISQAEALMGLDLITADDLRIPPEDDSLYVSDLIGCTVFDGSVEVGAIVDVQFPSALDGVRISDAAALLEIESPEGETLVPFVKAFIQAVDLPGRRIVMNLPPGLTAINRPDSKELL